MNSVSGRDRRQFGRKVTEIAAQAIPPGRAGIPCTIRNISQNGARLEFSRPFTSRATFRLLADNNKLDVQCVIRHQDATGAGVEFTSISVQKLSVPGRETDYAAPLYEAPPKPELVAAKGLELRQKLFRPASKPEAVLLIAPVPVPAVVVVDAAPPVTASEVIPESASATPPSVSETITCANVAAPVVAEVGHAPAAAPVDYVVAINEAMTAFIFDIATAVAPSAPNALADAS